MHFNIHGSWHHHGVILLIGKIVFAFRLTLIISVLCQHVAYSLISLKVPHNKFGAWENCMFAFIYLKQTLICKFGHVGYNAESKCFPGYSKVLSNSVLFNFSRIKSNYRLTSSDWIQIKMDCQPWLNLHTAAKVPWSLVQPGMLMKHERPTVLYVHVSPMQKDHIVF